MNLINTEAELKELIVDNKMTIVYFSGTTCGACSIIKIKLEEMLVRFPYINSYEVNGEKNPDIAAKYNIFSLPIMILFVDGKESLRFGRNVDFLDLEKQIDRYYQMVYDN